MHKEASFLDRVILYFIIAYYRFYDQRKFIVP